MKRFLTLLCCLSIFYLQSEIIETENIADIIPHIETTSLVLFDMDDTLTDSTISLGTGAWRKYIREKCHPLVHDYLTFQVARMVPVKPVERVTPFIVFDLQIQGIPVFVLTARGTSLWHDSVFSGVDTVTESQLYNASLEFNLSRVPELFRLLDDPTFKNGVFYTAPMKKGPYIKEFFQKSGYVPSKVVFIDDKLEQIKSVERAMMEIGVPFTGFWYKRAEVENRNVDQLLALIQMEALFIHERIISDETARRARDERGLTDPDEFLEELLTQIAIPALD